MSQQGPILIISNGTDPALMSAVGKLKLFPIVECSWHDAADAIMRLKPAAILAGNIDSNEIALHAIARQVDTLKPYTPIIALDPSTPLPDNVIGFVQSGRDPKHFVARLNAALRVRSLHATFMRRTVDTSTQKLPTTDPLKDATVLLLGRGGSYPALSVALGEQMGIVGALSIEAAAKHLNVRELNGIVIGEGFSHRVLDAFLVVLAEDARFRNLPVVLAGAAGMTANYDLPNLEITNGGPAVIAASAFPLIRQHAFDARIQRALKSIDAGGFLDPHTGLLTREAFDRDLQAAVAEMHERGGGLSVARMTFSPMTERTQFDAARILGRLMRRMDFATLDGKDSILITLAESDLRNAHMITRRFSSVLKHTMTGIKREDRVESIITLATLMPNDTATSLLARLNERKTQRAAS